MPFTVFSSIHPSHPFTSPLVSPDMVYSPETSLSQFSDLIFQRAIKPRWFTLQCATRSTADLLTSFSKRREKLSSENYTRFNITPEIEKDVASQRVDQSGKYGHKYGYTITLRWHTLSTTIHESPSEWQAVLSFPAYFLQLFQGTASPKASGDNDNVSDMRKPCNRIWLHAAQHCQAVCLSRRMERDAKSVRQQSERQFSTS